MFYRTLKLIFVIFLFSGILRLETFAAGIQFIQPVVASPLSGGGFNINTTLNIEGSFPGGTTLVAVFDVGEVSAPYQMIVSVSASSPSGTYPINLNLPSFVFAPGGSLVQFVLVDSSSLGVVGVSNLNIENQSPFQFFISSSDAAIVSTISGNEENDPDAGTEVGDDEAGTETGDPDAGTEVGDTSTVFQPGSINNPLGQDFDILDFLEKLFKNFVKIALPFLVLFTVYSGLLFVMARGNEEKLKEAKEHFLYVIIGATIVLGSWTLAKLLAGTVEQFEAFNFAMKLLV